MATPLLLGLLWLAAAGSPPRCDTVCVTPKASWLLKDHRYVMIGRVTEARWHDQANGTFTVTAIRVWKGDRKELVLETKSGGTSTCGYAMQQGKVYVVYADDERQEIDICRFAPIPAGYAKDIIKGLDRSKRLAPLSLSAADLSLPDSPIPR
jgi:hypothetical protein